MNAYHLVVSVFFFQHITFITEEVAFSACIIRGDYAVRQAHPTLVIQLYSLTLQIMCHITYHFPTQSTAVEDDSHLHPDLHPIQPPPSSAQIMRMGVLTRIFRTNYHRPYSILN